MPNSNLALIIVMAIIFCELAPCLSLPIPSISMQQSHNKEHLSSKSSVHSNTIYTVTAEPKTVLYLSDHQANYLTSHNRRLSAHEYDEGGANEHFAADESESEDESDPSFKSSNREDRSPDNTESSLSSTPEPSSLLSLESSYASRLTMDSNFRDSSHVSLTSPSSSDSLSLHSSDTASGARSQFETDAGNSKSTEMNLSNDSLYSSPTLPSGSSLSEKKTPPDTRRTASNRHEFTNTAHLSKMFLKLAKNYNIKSVVDIPCRNSLKFMPALLDKLDFEVPGFKYYCVDTEKESQKDIAHMFSDAGSPEFIHLNPATASMLPKTDLVFLWDGPQDWGVTTFWSFVMHLRQVRPKYILVTNNPGVLNGERDDIVNLRKQPFHFNQATRVINNVWDGNTQKQLLFYEIKHIRRGF